MKCGRCGEREGDVHLPELLGLTEYHESGNGWLCHACAREARTAFIKILTSKQELSKEERGVLDALRVAPDGGH